jgi:hypothetical protein
MAQSVVHARFGNRVSPLSWLGSTGTAAGGLINEIVSITKAAAPQEPVSYRSAAPSG